MNTKLVAIPGSSRKVLPSSYLIGDVNPQDPMTVTIALRPKTPFDLHAFRARNAGLLSRAEHAQNHGARLDDVAKVESFAARHHLTISEINLAARTIVLWGRTADMAAAFDVTLRLYGVPGKRQFRGREGMIFIPKHLDGIVTGVFGLDNRPCAVPHIRVGVGHHASLVQEKTYTIREMTEAYGFPSNLDGSGECVGVIELGGGYREPDIQAYCHAHGIDRVPQILAIGVNGARSQTNNDYAGIAETTADIETLAAVVPKAQIVVYFGTDTNDGMLNTIKRAVHDELHSPKVLSISWGSAESEWTEMTMREIDQVFQEAAALGITVFASAGDSGCGDEESDGQPHANFPASSPHAVSCGGTRVMTTSGRIAKELVWNNGPHGFGATGGGVSDVFARPKYQANVKVPLSPAKFAGRGVPDISGNADPLYGYKFIIGDKEVAGGGTSIVTPLYAGLMVLINQARREAGAPPAGFVHEQLYTTEGLCRDITQGNNDYSGTFGVYASAPGWDACTGFGSVNGKQWMNAFVSRSRASGTSAG